MANEPLILDRIAAIGLQVAGVNPDGIYSFGGTDQVAGVKDLPEDIDVALPAFVVTDGGMSIIPGARERATWTVVVSVWAEFGPRGQRLRELTEIRRDLRAAMRNNDKGNAADLGVQAVVVTEIDPIRAEQWRRGENAPWYLVLRVPLPVVVHETVTYTQI